MRRVVYYGWVLVVTLGVTETISWGILYYTFAVYLAPMQAELGWSRGEMTGAFSVALLVAGLAAIPVGRWLDRHGPRLLMTVGSVAAAGLVLAWSRVSDTRPDPGGWHDRPARPGVATPARRRGPQRRWRPIRAAGRSSADTSARHGRRRGAPSGLVSVAGGRVLAVDGCHDCSHSGVQSEA